MMGTLTWRSVDISFIGYWGEGSGTHLLRNETRIALISAYLDHFKKTHLIFQPLNGDAPDPGVLVRGRTHCCLTGLTEGIMARDRRCVTSDGVLIVLETWVSVLNWGGKPYD